MNNEIIWSYCSSCGQETKSTILFKKSIVDVDKDLEFKIEYGKETYFVVECNGCESVSFRKEYDNFFYYEIDQPQSPKIEVKIFPSVLENHKPIENIGYLPKKIRDVYNQTILALKGESKLLAGVGFRAVIEAICIEEKIKGKNLEEKINALAKNRLITEKESERLHTIRFLGNDSVHEMEIPSDKKLFLVLNIVEHLLNNLYIIDVNSKYVLDTIIKNYNDFEILVRSCVEKSKIGEQKTLKEILGKHIRRVALNLDDVESTLVSRIKEKEVDFLEMVEMSSDSEINEKKYLIKEVIDDLPF